MRMSARRHAAPVVMALGLILCASGSYAQDDGAGPGRPGARTRRAQRVDPLTASIRGTVTAADSGAPVRGAEVRLSSDSSYSRLATTDGDGRFELRDLPAGEFKLTVSRAGFTSAQFGQRRPFEAPTLIDLSEGESATANVILTRGGAIYGRVLDQFGEPVTGTRVQALRARMSQGQRRLQSLGAGDQTDDTGAFRLYGLAPGDYYVTASAGAVDSVKRDPPIYYPGTPSFAEAQPITIGPGTEAAADLQLMPVRNARVSGVVLNSSGAPVEAMVRLASEAIGLEPATETSVVPFGISADAGPDGRFTLENVPPGPYTLTANSSFMAGAAAGRAAADPTARPDKAMQDLIARGPETASLSMVVTGDDVSGITLTTRRGGILSGSFAADSGVVKALPTGLRVSVRSLNAGGMSMMQGGRGSEFRLAGMDGPFYLDVQGIPEGWAVSQITVDGTNVTDEPIDLKGQNATARIVLTDRVTTISGVVQSRNVAADRTVLIFPDDSTKWTYPSRYVRTARTDDQGRFWVMALPPNERYQAVAVDFLGDGDEQDPQLLDRLRSYATSLSLGEGEQRSIYLDLVAR